MISDKFYLGYIDENVTCYLDDILQVKLEDHVNTPQRETMIRFSAKRKSESTKKIIDIIKPFFEESGFQVNLDNGYIGYESFTYNSHQYVDTLFDISCENENFDDVQVCYIITKKDEGLKSGNMMIYNEYSFWNMIGIKDANTQKIPLQRGSVLIMKGDIYHRLTGCYGFGELNLIRIVCYRNKRLGYSCDNDDDEYQ
jgi:hypothetical protein